MHVDDPGIQSESFWARLLFWVTDELLCVGAGIGAVAGAVALGRHPPSSGWLLAGGVAGLGYLLIASYTLSVYLQRRRTELRLAMRGETPGRDLGRMAGELLRLSLVHGAAMVLDALKVGLVLASLAAFLLDSVLLALFLFVVVLDLSCRVEEGSLYLREKLRRFYEWDGVVVVRDPGAPEEARRRPLRERLDGALDAFLFPPLTMADLEYMHLDRAEVRVSAELPCRVCGDALEGSPVVACARCQTPHHADCFEWAARCAVYGCGGEESSPAVLAGPDEEVEDPLGPAAAAGS